MNNNNIEMYIRMTLEGHTEAFEKIYRQTNKRIYFICYQLLANEDDARDAVQDTYLTAYKNLHQLSDPVKFLSWLDRIAINRCKDMLKKNKPIYVDDDILKETVLSEDELALPEKYIIDREKRHILMDIMRTRLTQLQYQTVILYYFNNLSVAEIAEIMECTQGAVMNRLSKARANIKSAINEYQSDSDDKLFVFAGVPFMAKFLYEECKATAAPDISTGIMSQVNSLASAGSAAAISNSTVAAKAGFFSTAAGKIIVAAVTVVLIGGGITAAVVINSNHNTNETQETISNPFGSQSITEKADITDTETSKPEQSAADDESLLTGICGDNATYTVYSDGTMMIDGSGVVNKAYLVWELKDTIVKKVIISEGITEIGESVFSNAQKMESISLPDTLQKIELTAFTACYELTEIAIPDSVTKFETGCFSNCNKLEHVTLSKNITFIPRNAFENCEKLQEIIIPEGVTTIKNGAFFGCSELKSITLPNTLQDIEYAVFFGNRSLKNITIPGSIEYIGESVFSQWGEEQTITIEGKSSVPENWAGSWDENCAAKIIWNP